MKWIKQLNLRIKMTNRKTLSALAFVLLLSPCLLNSVSKEYVAEKAVNFATTACMAGTQFKAQTKTYYHGSTYSDTVSNIALGTTFSLLARITFRELLKESRATKSSNIKDLAKDALSSGFSIGIGHLARKHNEKETTTEQNVVGDSLVIAGLTTLFELGIDFLDYYYNS